MNRFQKDAALSWIDGYYFSLPGEGKVEEKAFLRAKQETIKVYRQYIKNLEETTFEMYQIHEKELEKNKQTLTLPGTLIDDIITLVKHVLQFEGNDFDEVVSEPEVHGIKPKGISEAEWQNFYCQYDDARNSFHSSPESLEKSSDAMEKLALFTDGHVFCSAVRVCRELEK